MNAQLVKVSEDEFRKALAELALHPPLESNRVNICEPPITNFFTTDPRDPVARIIHHWAAGKSLGNGLSECIETPEYYLKENL